MLLYNYNLTLKDAIVFSLFISFLLFCTGFATIPFAVKHGLIMQNLIYFLGRVPVILIGILVFLKLKEGRECKIL
jgi:hypothetical protein